MYVRVGINSFHMGAQRHYLKEIFMELCIALPVRLSNLLPYLTLLLSPVITSLTCSENVVTQGMRTIELCADHLHQDYFQDHLHSVIGELLHGLWSNVRAGDSSAAASATAGALASITSAAALSSAGAAAGGNDTARTAARILGKLGGANRRPMLHYESQPLAYAPLPGLAADAELLTFGVDLLIADAPTTALPLPLALTVDRVRAAYMFCAFVPPVHASICVNWRAARRQHLYGADASGHLGARQ